MTVKQLMDMYQLLKAARIDCGCLTIEEIEGLTDAVETELYIQRVKDFQNDVVNAMPGATAPDAAMEKFYDTDWHISFGNKSVVIHNEATVYGCITDMLETYINNCL